MRIFIGDKDITQFCRKGSALIAGSCFCLLLYLYVFNPPFQAFPLSPIKLLYPFFILYFLLKLNFRTYIRCVKRETQFFAAIILYSFLVETFSGVVAGQEELLFRANIFSYIETIFFSYVIVKMVQRYFPRMHIYNFLFIITLLAGCITLYMIANPAYTIYVRSSLLVTTEMVEKFSFRAFGIADSLLFTYGTVQGLVLAIVMYYSYQHKWLLLTLPVFVVAIIFNARMGLVPPMLMVAYCIMKGRELKRLNKIFLFSIVLLFLVQSLSFLEDYQRTLEWASDFFVEIWNVVTGAESGKPNNMDNLKNSIYLPETLLGSLFGTGRNVYFLDGNNSDVGYIIQLHYGGILYCALLMGLVLYMYMRLRQQKEFPFFSFLFLFTILLTNYKGYFISSNPGFRFLCLVYFFYVTRRSDEKIPQPFW